MKENIEQFRKQRYCCRTNGFTGCKANSIWSNVTESGLISNIRIYGCKCTAQKTAEIAPLNSITQRV